LSDFTKMEDVISLLNVNERLSDFTKTEDVIRHLLIIG
jgi:hypothetical protein